MKNKIKYQKPKLPIKKIRWIQSLREGQASGQPYFRSKCSIPLAIREKQIKTTLKFHLTHQNFFKRREQMLPKTWEKLIYLIKAEPTTGTKDISTEVSLKIQLSIYMIHGDVRQQRDIKMWTKYKRVLMIRKAVSLEAFWGKGAGSGMLTCRSLQVLTYKQHSVGRLWTRKEAEWGQRC